MNHAPQVLINEVGPRGGLQSVKATMSTAHKCTWISALHAAGLPGEPLYGMTPEAALPPGFAQVSAHD